MHDNLGNSMPTLDFNANLEDLNFAKINALFFLMGTLDFRTVAPSGGGGATTNSHVCTGNPLENRQGSF